MKSLALCIGSSLTASLLLFGNSTSAAGYDENVMHNFMGGCMKAALANNTSPGYASRYCHCLWDAVTTEMTFEDFAMADRGSGSLPEQVHCGEGWKKLRAPQGKEGHQANGDDGEDGGQ